MSDREIDRQTGAKSVDIRYQLLEEVGQGGMAVVYKGTDKTLNREVAVKVLHPHLASHPESRARLQREAHAVAKLKHDNILEIFDYSGPESSDSYIVTEFIHGQTLKSFLGVHALPFPELAEMIVSEVAAALEHAHSVGVIHRDVKPENVMIRDDGRLKLMDFGIAQIVDKERMTMTGQLLGSPAYMAPEHIDGKPIDFRTDVFAVGILTYQLATGELPFRGRNPHEVLKRIADCKYQPPEVVNSKVGKRLSRIIAKSLERDPNNRYPTAGALRKDLLEDLSDVEITEPRKTLTDFFAAPEAFAKRFRPILVARLVARGRELRGRGRTAAALDLWGRARELDPNSAEIRALIEGVARRQTFFKVASRTAIALSLVGASVAGLRAIRRHLAASGARSLAAGSGTENATHPSISPRANPPAITPAISPTSLALESAHRAALHHQPKVATQHETPAPPMRPQSVELVPTPKAVRISLDGTPLGDYGPSLSHVEITGDRAHSLLFENPACYPERVEIKKGEVPSKIPVRLKWKSARLTIVSDPPDADLVVDGNIVVHSGSPIPVTIPELSPDGRRTISLKASAPGRRSHDLHIQVRANEQQLENVKLEASSP